MKGQSKFDFGLFYDCWGDERFFAVSKQRYSKEQAIECFLLECDNPETYEISDAAVMWRAGRDADNEPHVGWYLEGDCDGTEPRCCPVWVFEY